MSSMLNYTYDLPHITRCATNSKRVFVEYEAFNGLHHSPICRYKGAEFPCTSFKATDKIAYRLSKFIDNGELPRCWGKHHQQVTGSSPSFFDTTINKISYLNLERQLKWSEPNLKEALSWPLGVPTLAFFKLSRVDSYVFNWEEKCLLMTLIMRCGEGDQIDQSLVNLYKKMIVELNNREIAHLNFTGQDIEKEIAYVQVLRMLTAIPYDYYESEFHSLLYDYVKELSMVITPHLLGNRKWTPLATMDPRFMGLVDEWDSDFDSDFDQDELLEWDAAPASQDRGDGKEERVEGVF
ncbi:nonstructural protein [Turuna virus]|uniref:Nonstructural protein n=1 Tax=Turuna virus TaxID=629737 RepID=F2W3T4_9VIRU|nr:nonstructural protein [Turuna virus]AEA30086.1 nonstructural protein [Turuna virus]